MKYQLAHEMDAKMLSLEGDWKNYKERLLLSSSGSLECVYAPFDYLNTEAKVIIVGLTPGDQKAQNALREYCKARRLNSNVVTALKSAKTFASFSGPMRNNLTRMLDFIRLNSTFGIPSTNELFHQNSNLANFTSVLRYPIFKANKNYSGSPSPIRSEFLIYMLDKYLGHEVDQLHSALWIPLGPAATAAMRRTVVLGHLSEANLLEGLPHP